MKQHDHHHFYMYLVPLDSLVTELEQLDMSDEERTELLTIIHSHLHYTVIDIVLTHLSNEDKKHFLEYAEQDNHEKTWSFLKEKMNDAEEKIKEAAEGVKNELLEDIKELKEKR